MHNYINNAYGSICGSRNIIIYKDNFLNIHITALNINKIYVYTYIATQIYMWARISYLKSEDYIIYEVYMNFPEINK